MNEIRTGRTLETVTAEIVTITTQTRYTMVSAAIEIGRRLVEAKELVPHGEWGKYLEEQVDFSASQANNMMRLFNEYGSGQESLFGSGSEAIKRLSVTSAIRLLSLPAEEREEFAEENNVAEMSTRELEKAIRERNEARQAQEAARQEADSTAQALAAAQAEAEKRKQALAATERKLEEATRKEQEAKEALKQLKENPTVPEDLMSKLRQDARTAAQEEAARAAEEQLGKLKAAQASAEKKAAEAQEALAEARKQAALNDPEAAVFKLLFGQVQEDFRRMAEALGKVQDAALADKLRGAVRQLLERMGGRL